MAQQQLRLLEQYHHHPRDKQIRLNRSIHEYKVNWEGNGIYSSMHTISVTTLVGMFWNRFNPDRALKQVNTHNPQGKYFGKSHEEIKQLWATAGADAREAGTAMHDLIERYYNKEISPWEFPQHLRREYQLFLNFSESITDLLEPYRSEWLVHTATQLGYRKRKYDEINAVDPCPSQPVTRICGGIDMVFVDLVAMQRTNNNHEILYIQIYDWKRAKTINKWNRFDKAGFPPFDSFSNCNYYHYCAQLNLYRYILEQHYHNCVWKGDVYRRLQVTGMVLCVIHPRSRNFRLYPCVEMHVEIAEAMSLREKSLQLEMRGKKGLFPFDQTAQIPNTTTTDDTQGVSLNESPMNFDSVPSALTCAVFAPKPLSHVWETIPPLVV